MDLNIIEKLKTDLENDGIEKTVVGAVVSLEEDKILLLKRVSDDFMGGLVELPSGGVDKGETILEALVREIKEETGLTISEIKNYIGYFDYTSGSGKKSRQLNFLVSTENGEVKLAPEEHSEYYIISTKDEKLKELNISEKTRDIIIKSKI